MSKSFVILGGGGHALVLMDILNQLGHVPVACISRDEPIFARHFPKVKWYKDDMNLAQFTPEDITLVNGVGSVPGKPNIRRAFYKRGKELGFTFATVVAPQATVSELASLDEGVQIMAGAVVQAGSSIGANAIVNTSASIDHDCQIGKHCHVAPGSTLSGNVTLGEEVHIGTGAAIIHSISICSGSIIGAGVCVNKSVVTPQTLFPARNHVMAMENK